MDAETQNGIIELVEKHTSTISSLVVTWYGGEPLLAFDTIVSLSERFIEICDKNDITYKADIITNGYLLTPQRAKKLTELKVCRYQITVDGPKDIHNIRRPLNGGYPTFDRIIANLSDCKDILAGIIFLRINVDRGNEESVNEVVKVLQENRLNDIVYPYLGMLFDDDSSLCADFECYENCEFAEVDMKFNLSMNNYKKRIASNYPTKRGNFCAGDYDRAFTIGPDGKIYKCYVDMGIPERAVADINDEYFRNSTVLSNYVLYDPTVDAECADCRFLPICVGGCPHSRIYKGDKRCTTLKYNFDKYMEMFPSIMADKML